MAVNYFANCHFIGNCDIIWQTEAVLHWCRKENQNSSELPLAAGAGGGISPAILTWRLGASSQDRSPLAGMKGEKSTDGWI